MERLSKSARERLAQDDAEIKMYERKLGIKGRKSSRKDDDGLGELLGEDMDMDQSDEDSKRKRDEYDTWLASKRRKSTHQGKLELQTAKTQTLTGSSLGG
jgi:nucleolar MIF4G domain-containing protein 1